jgi:hypothetical protein
VVEQEALLRFVGVGVRFQAPAALPMAFQVHTVPGSTASLNGGHAAHLAPLRFDPDPVAVGDALRRNAVCG